MVGCDRHPHGLLDRYQEWRDNLPASLADSALAERLDAMLEWRDLVDQLSLAAWIWTGLKDCRWPPPWRRETARRNARLEWADYPARSWFRLRYDGALDSLTIIQR